MSPEAALTVFRLDVMLRHFSGNGPVWRELSALISVRRKFNPAGS
jgi:hypothetical protein